MKTKAIIVKPEHGTANKVRLASTAIRTITVAQMNTSVAAETLVLPGHRQPR